MLAGGAAGVLESSAFRVDPVMRTPPMLMLPTSVKNSRRDFVIMNSCDCAEPEPDVSRHNAGIAIPVPPGEIAR